MPGAGGLADLSPREREVLEALAEHRTNAEIAARFVLSVRTVESHVASLLRKTGAESRRALADLGAAAARPPDARRPAPTPPSSFIGRVEERAALGAALAAHRLVTAVGPGGVGKTRIALSIARDPGSAFPDGAVYVDLVPVADPARAAAAIAAAAGIGAQQAATPEDALVAWLAGRRLLLVLDNCEHLLDGIAPLAERLLTRADGLSVLTTSRTRLLVPFERVVTVPGLSVDRGSASGDAVELFRQRAEGQGARITAADAAQVARICARLDGLALAIELAAARLPALGLDGLEEGLGAALDLLEGGGRSDGRHRSVRATLDWSVALLQPADRAALARLAAFAVPFDAGSAAVLLDRPTGGVQALLGRLADSSLLTPHDGRYLMLETVRQHGLAALEDDGGLEAVRTRHLEWATTADALPFDRIAPELRSGLAWAAPRPPLRDAAFAAATRLATLAFDAGAPAESQTASEQAAALAPDDRAAIASLRDAAGAAEARHVGLDAMRLHGEAARRAEAAGDARTAAIELARIAMLVVRAPGLMAVAIPIAEAAAPLAEAARLAGDDPVAHAHVRVMRTFYGPTGLVDVDAAPAAIAAAAAIGDPLLEGVALDGLVAWRLAHRDIAGSLAACLRRTELLTAVPVSARTGIEFPDAYSMTCECAFAAGDLPTARRFAELVRTLPMYAREPHLAVGRAMTVGFLVGEWAQVTALAPMFLDAWDRAGRPRAGNLFVGSQSAAGAYAMVGDDETAARWRALAPAIRTPDERSPVVLSVAYTRALPLLARGAADEAMTHLRMHPDSVGDWQNGLWRPWYAALWAEAAVLAGSPDAAHRITDARRHAGENPIAQALLDRAEALLAGADPAPIAARLDALGARFQAARTRVLSGGADAQRGQDELAALAGSAAVP